MVFVPVAGALTAPEVLEAVFDVVFEAAVLSAPAVVDVAACVAAGAAVAAAATAAVSSVPEPPPQAVNKTAAQAQDKAVIEKR